MGRFWGVFGGFLGGFWKGFWEGFGGFLGGFWEGFGGFLGSFWGVFRGVFGRFFERKSCYFFNNFGLKLKPFEIFQCLRLFCDLWEFVYALIFSTPQTPLKIFQNTH